MDSTAMIMRVLTRAFVAPVFVLIARLALTRVTANRIVALQAIGFTYVSLVMTLVQV